ncbi:B-cell CLL/lymphoma 9-like protein [Physella acuta]|uniref:B-cell CLL/lymphoma 9-like protein n=1 Tax=Physella acuta TaxID=109671 RepID=UPI0027DC41ED|nr:B-cell CLL/lymphoma 9-like protein [Physella acuta]
MKERVDSSKMLREPGINGPAQDAVAGGVSKLDSADVKAEVKEEDGRKSTDIRPPSRKIPNGDSDSTLAVKSEDNNNKRIKLEKKNDNNSKKENGKAGCLGTDSQKSSPQPSTPQHPSSGGTTPATMMSAQHGMVASLEPPFMQQQSEIFVFSTNMANQAAESVQQGHYKSILQFHMDHPETKAFLQKNPLKANYRQGMAPNMMGGMKGQPGHGMMRMHGPMPPSWGPQMPPGPGMEDPNMMGPGGMMPNGPYQPGGPGPRMMGGWPGQGCGGPHPHSHGQMGPCGYKPSMMDMENEMMMAGHHNPNISSSQVPDENLTLEQRQHRAKGLSQLTKIHQMLMGGNGQHDGGQPPMGPDGHPGGPGMYPGGPGMMSPQQQAMMSQQQAMMSQGGMMHPHGMMSPQHQHMMAQQGMSPYGPRGPPGMGPGMNGKEQYQAQHDWFQIQRDYYMEKQHRIHMANRGPPHMEPGPPPSYYSSISQKHGSMGPASPTMNGMRMPMPPHGPHGPMGPGMDPDGMGMYGGPPDMCRPPHMGMEPMPGMHGYPPHGMPPQGPMDPGFDPTMAGGMPPVMGPGSGGPRSHGPMRQGHMMGPNGMMPGMKGPNQVTLHRAGNPEQFNPETMGGVVPPITPSGNNNSSKPPPSYAQAQKRKRGDDIDDSYAKGNLQQTPSPTKIHYHLSQFEGQELTITKQLNSAFVAGNGGDESNSIGPIVGSGPNTTPGLYNSHANSPLHGPGSNKGPHSNSSQTSVHMANSPAVSTAGPSPHQLPPGPATPHSSTTNNNNNAGASMRLSHFDPTPLSNGVNSAPHTPNPKSSSSMSNITSASLANLAKGVENLSNQMQQNMMQGGPFHSIQVQGQMTSSSGNTNNANSNSNNSSSAAAAATTSSSTLSSHSGSVTSSQAPSTPSVNNTYIATNMSISQVNVPNHPSMNSYVSMQMQSMSTESPHMNMPPCSMQHGMGPQMGGPGMMGPGGPRPGMSHHLAQSQGMMTSMGPMPGVPSPGMGPGPLMPSGPMPASMNPVGPMPPHRPNSSSSMPPTPPTMTKSGQFTSPPLSHAQMSSGSGSSMSGVTSPSFPITSSSNSSVQIQQKGHNTIQYLPANPPSSQPSSAKQRSDIDYSMPRYPSPLHNMDGKNPPSTLQYFPNSSPTGHRPQMSSALSAAAAMGPEFANQATIAMHQSASMMRSSSIPDLQALQGNGPNMPPSSMGMGHGMGGSMGMGPMDNPGHMVGPMGGGPMMGGPDSMMGMRPGHSPGSMRQMPPGMGPGSLECVSPIPGMGGYMNNGPSIEQAQAQAQAHAAMMMQGNNQMPVSSPHGPMSSGGPSPLMAPHGPMPGSSMHGPMPPGGMPGSSPHHMQGPPQMSLQSHGSMSGPSPHGPMGGPSPHGPMGGPSPHGPMPVPSPHSSMSGPMPPHMGHMHGPGMPHGAMPRHPGMAGMRMPGPGMGGMPMGPGQYSGMQYPGYQQDYYSSGPPRGHPRQMMAGMMGGPGQPYGMMPGPS